MAKGDTGVRCFQGLLILGNVVIGCCGLALMAECIFFVSDQHSLYPLLEATDNDDIYGAAWIGIFTGFCFFCLSVLGIVGVIKSSRTMLLVYIILMMIVFAFEVASSITATVHRDFVSILPVMCLFSQMLSIQCRGSANILKVLQHLHMLTNELFLKQMLEKYQNPDPINNDDKWKSEGITKTWNRLMLQNKCCGVNGPTDWQTYTSVFRTVNSDADFPWPRQCCVMDLLGKATNLDGCKLGVSGFYHTTGCFETIAGPMNRHAWGVAWFGFAILCWTTWVLLCTMFYWSRIEY